MPLGMEVGLGPGHIVLDGDPASPKRGPASTKGAQPQLFGPCLLWPNGWIDQDMPLDTKVGLGPAIVC